MDKQKLMGELFHSLPSRRITDVVNFCAIKVGSEYFVLKDRYEGIGGYITKDLNEELLTDYKQIEPMSHTYIELLCKNILIDKRILHRRGLDAIIEYLESKEMA